jgi:predicted RNase H-like nuclease (RuvC/YqgF family)
VKALRGKTASASGDEVLRKEMHKLEEENAMLVKQNKAVEAELQEAKREIERLRYNTTFTLLHVGVLHL